MGKRQLRSCANWQVASKYVYIEEFRTCILENAPFLIHPPNPWYLRKSLPSINEILWQILWVHLLCWQNLRSSVPEGQDELYITFVSICLSLPLYPCLFSSCNFLPSLQPYGERHMYLSSSPRELRGSTTLLCSVWYVVSRASGDALSVMANSICWD